MADSDLTSRSHNLFRGQVNDKKNFRSNCDGASLEYLFPNRFSNEGRNLNICIKEEFSFLLIDALVKSFQKIYQIFDRFANAVIHEREKISMNSRNSRNRKRENDRRRSLDSPRSASVFIYN